MSELKRCPFCGGDNVGVWHNRPVSPLIADSYEVRCYNCNFGLRPERLKDKAIEAWNTRKPIQNIVERMEEVGELEITAHSGRCNGKTLTLGFAKGIKDAIKIVKEEGGTE